MQAVFWGQGLGLETGVPAPSAMAVSGPHVALGILTLPLSETFLQDIAPDIQAPLHPLSPPSAHFQKLEGASCHVPGAVPSPVYLTHQSEA